MSDSPIKVTVYGAEWCPPCHTTRDYLKNRKVSFDYVNVDEHTDKGREIAVKTGWTAIPIISIGDKYILGFDRPKIDAALEEFKLM